MSRDRWFRRGALVLPADKAGGSDHTVRHHLRKHKKSNNQIRNTKESANNPNRNVPATCWTAKYEHRFYRYLRTRVADSQYDRGVNNEPRHKNVERLSLANLLLVVVKGRIPSNSTMSQ